MNNKKIAFLGLFVALAFVLSYIEYMLPLNIGIPGAKVGFANLVVMVALYTVGEKNAIALSIIRVILVGLTFGNISMMMYSLAGAALSLCAMLIAKRIGKLSVTGVSVIGGVFHNIGQIIDADKIYVLQEGHVVQGGTPDEVYKQGGIYKDIFDASARSMNADKIAATLG